MRNARRARCELFGFFACSGRLFGAVEFQALVRVGTISQNPHPLPTPQRVRHPQKIGVHDGGVEGLATRREDCIYFLS